MTTVKPRGVPGCLLCARRALAHQDAKQRLTYFLRLPPPRMSAARFAERIEQLKQNVAVAAEVLARHVADEHAEIASA